MRAAINLDDEALVDAAAELGTTTKLANGKPGIADGRRPGRVAASLGLHDLDEIDGTRRGERSNRTLMLLFLAHIDALNVSEFDRACCRQNGSASARCVRPRARPPYTSGLRNPR
jgi:hypothetical protein